MAGTEVVSAGPVDETNAQATYHRHSFDVRIDSPRTGDLSEYMQGTSGRATSRAAVHTARNLT